MDPGAKDDRRDGRRARIEAAWSRRSAIARERGLEAVRVLNGPGDQAPAGLTLDRYGDWLVLAAREQVVSAEVERWAEAARDTLGPAGLVVKRLRRPVSKSSSARWMGVAPAEPLIVREGDARFLIDVDDGISTGLFLDHRETRFAIREHARGAEVLNLFSYTGAFSVHAALAGAQRVTSVDAAKRALRRGRANMSQSGLDPDRHRWFDDDVLAHLARQARRGPSYALVIADPPVYGHSERGRFTLSEQLQAIVDGCLASVLPGGVLVLSTHAMELGEGPLLDGVRERAAVRARPVEVLARMGLPEWDHPTAPGEVAGDRGDYLKTLVLRVG